MRRDESKECSGAWIKGVKAKVQYCVYREPCES